MRTAIPEPEAVTVARPVPAASRAAAAGTRADGATAADPRLQVALAEAERLWRRLRLALALGPLAAALAWALAALRA